MDIQNKNEAAENAAVPNLQDAPSLDIAMEAVRILDSKKAGDIRLLHVEEKTVLTEYFVLCTGNSSTQVKSLADELEYQMERRNFPPVQGEGFDGATWIVTDFGPVIVHIFNRETRMFYNLEKLWSDSKEVDLSSVIDVAPQDESFTV